MEIFRIVTLLCLIIFSFSNAYAENTKLPKITLKGQGENQTIYVPVRGSISAVVYERGARTWLVQSTPQFWSQEALGSFEAKVYHQNYVSALSLKTPEGQRPLVKFMKDGIHITFASLNAEKAKAPEYKKQPISGNIEFTVPAQEKPGDVIKFDDPDHGDVLMLVPLKTDKYQVQKAFKFVDFQLYKSTAGLIFQPLIDDLQVTSKKGKVLVSSAKGLRLAFTQPPEAFIPPLPPRPPENVKTAPLEASISTPQIKQKAVTIAKEALEQALPHQVEPEIQTLQVVTKDGFSFTELTPFLRVEDWETNIPFEERQNELQEGVYDKAGNFLPEEAYNLARFYVTYGMGPEARNVLNGIGLQDPEKVGEAKHIGLMGLTKLLCDEFFEGFKLISNPLLDKDPRIVTWRWVANFLKSVEEGDKTAVLPGTVRINHLPYELKYAVLSRLMKNALRVEDFDNYKALSEIARFDARRPAERYYLTYLDGWYNYMTDQIDTAFDLWEKVAEEGDRLNSVQARYAFLYKGLEAAKLTRDEVMRGLEYLSYAWRGDDFEHKTRYQLAKMFYEDGRVRESLMQYKALIMQFPSHPQAAEITTRMTAAFTEYMLETPDDMPKIDVAAMFEEFKELTPIGEKGDQIYLKVANIYMDLSLPDEAAPILQHLTQFKLQGEQKADAGMKLCSLYIEKAKWDSALQALTTTESKDLSEDTMCERAELRARILLNQGHFEQVLTLLEGKDDDDNQRLRARAYVGLKKWGDTKNIYDKLLRSLPAEEPLSPVSQFDVLNYAIALVFENDFEALSGVQKKYGEEMLQGPFSQAFSLVSTSLSSDKVKDLTSDVTKLTNLYQQFKDPQKS